MTKFKLICAICEYAIAHSSKAIFEECGVLFWHKHHDKSYACDLDGDHNAEPKVIEVEIRSKEVKTNAA